MNKKYLIVIIAIVIPTFCCLSLLAVGLLLYRPIVFHPISKNDRFGEYNLVVDFVSLEENSSKYHQNTQALFLQKKCLNCDLQRVPISSVVANFSGTVISSHQVATLEFNNQQYLILRKESGIEGSIEESYDVYKLDQQGQAIRVAEDSNLVTCPGISPYLSINKLVFPKFSKCSEPLPAVIDVLVNLDGVEIEL